MLQTEPRENRHQAFGGKIFRHPQTQHTLAFQIEQYLAGLFLQGQDTSGIGQQTFALRSGHYSTLFAVE